VRSTAGGTLPLGRRSETGAKAPSSKRKGPLVSLGRWRWVLALAGLVLIGLLVGAYVSWHFSSRVLVPDHSNRPEDVTVEDVSSRRIVLERDEDTLRPGVYGLDWQSGHAIVGRILASDESTVTRRLLDVRGYLVPEEKVAVDTGVYAGNPRQARGLPFKTVSIPDELGPMNAWLIPAADPHPSVPGGSQATTWAIVVHGINDDPQVGLRLAPTLRSAGLASLLITYREDLGAPGSPDGLHHMGLTEWKDLQAAAHYALSHGARSLILIGYSMGGSLVTQFMQHSALAGHVRGLILDGPVLSWQAILSYNATEMGLPAVAAKPVEWVIGARIDADWNDLNALKHTEDLELPILLFHGMDDTVIPPETSDELAEKLPEWVTYYRPARAEHTQSWNVNPPLYERRVQAFLARGLALGAGDLAGGHSNNAASPAE
jgi:alpha-beta hydrolase superfamily lysophospholipase